MYNTMYATREQENDTPLVRDDIPEEEATAVITETAAEVEEEIPPVVEEKPPVIKEPTTIKCRVKTPVNFRIDPDTDKQNVIGVFKKDVIVDAKLPIDNGGWASVTYEGKSGYVKAEYLEEV